MVSSLPLDYIAHDTVERFANILLKPPPFPTSLLPKSPINLNPVKSLSRNTL